MLNIVTFLVQCNWVGIEDVDESLQVSVAQWAHV